MSRHALAVTVLGLNYPPEPTGISPYTGAMARGLTHRGFRTRVVTAHPHYPEWRISSGYGQWSRREQLDGVAVTRLRHFVPSHPTGVRRLLSELSFGARASATGWGKPDAIIAVSPALFASAFVSARARLAHRKVPFVVWVQDLYALGMSETGQGAGRAGQIVRATERWLLRRADRVVVIHDRFAKRVADDFGVAPERITVIRNWTHLAAAPAVDRDAARRELGWGPEIVVLHAGNMGVKQGLENVLEAARLASRRDVPVRFVLMGNGGERPHLESAGQAISSLQFIDPLPDDQFAKALAAADVLLVNEKPGVSEMAVPSKLTSYFSAGRPVLAATDVRGITADEIRAAEAGVVVRAGDAAQLLDAALELGGDPARSAVLGENGRRYRDSVLDESFAIERFATLLTELVTGDDDRKN